MAMRLEKTWRECLRMWKWIAEHEETTGRGTCALKKEWLDVNGYKEGDITANCFFCDYATKRNGFGDISLPTGYSRLIKCSKCPGRLVGKRFSCQRPAYDWYFKPKKFYQKLLRLNKQRKQKGGKK